MKLLACTVVLSLCAFATPARVQAETLALPNLVNRADLWPTAVTLNRAFDFAGGTSVKAGQSVKVLEFDGARVVVDAGDDLVFAITPGDCDLLAAANKAWSALTPAQRAIDARTLAEDASLWPERITSSAAFGLEDGTRLEPNGEYEFLSYDGQSVRFYSTQHRMTLDAALAQTDLIARARQRALIEPAKRPSRVAAVLKKSLVDSAGKPHAGAGFDDAQIFVLYSGASWCPPCRRFSPRLVEFVNKVGKDNPRLATVLLSNDREDEQLHEYMQDEKMPWPAVPLEALQKAPLLLGYSGRSIPHLVIVDRYGLVLASSVENGGYVGVDKPLETLAKLVESGKAK